MTLVTLPIPRPPTTGSVLYVPRHGAHARAVVVSTRPGHATLLLTGRAKRR